MNLWPKMHFSKIPKFDPLEARTGGFTGPMGKKKVGGVVFVPKPPPDPNFIKIGLGHRTLVLHLLIFGLLSYGLAMGRERPDVARVESQAVCPCLVCLLHFLQTSLK